MFIHEFRAQGQFKAECENKRSQTCPQEQR